MIITTLQTSVYFQPASTGSVSYQRGSSPYDDEAHIIGSIDSAAHAGGLEQKAT